MSDDGPVLLMHYDPDGDDRRGTESQVGIYRSRARAQHAADVQNMLFLGRWNARRRHENEAEGRRIAEHNALVDAGLRETRFSVPHIPWVDVESVNDKRYNGDRYLVDEVEYDDD